MLESRLAPVAGASDRQDEMADLAFRKEAESSTWPLASHWAAATPLLARGGTVAANPHPLPATDGAFGRQKKEYADSLSIVR